MFPLCETSFFLGGGGPVIHGVLYYNMNFLARLFQVTSCGPPTPVKEQNEYKKSLKKIDHFCKHHSCAQMSLLRGCPTVTSFCIRSSINKKHNSVHTL